MSLSGDLSMGGVTGREESRGSRLEEVARHEKEDEVARPTEEDMKPSSRPKGKEECRTKADASDTAKEAMRIKPDVEGGSKVEKERPVAFASPKALPAKPSRASATFQGNPPRSQLPHLPFKRPGISQPHPSVPATARFIDDVDGVQYAGSIRAPEVGNNKGSTRGGNFVYDRDSPPQSTSVCADERDKLPQLGIIGGMHGDYSSSYLSGRSSSRRGGCPPSRRGGGSHSSTSQPDVKEEAKREQEEATAFASLPVKPSQATAALNPGGKPPRPGSLDLSFPRPGTPQPHPSGLATARFIDDLDSVQYPEGIKNPDMGASKGVTKGGKFVQS